MTREDPGMSSMTTALQTAQFGVMGLGVMGENLTLNVEDHGYRVAVWTHSAGKVDRFTQKNRQKNGADRQWVAARTLEDFVRCPATPCR